MVYVREYKQLYYPLEQELAPEFQIHVNHVSFELTGRWDTPCQALQFGLVFIDSGRGWAKQAGHREAVQDGDILIIFPRAWYDYKAEGGPWHMYTVGFSATGLQPHLRRAGLSPRSYLCRGCDHDRVRSMWAKLLQLADYGDWRGSLRIPLLVYSLLNEMLEATAARSSSSPTGLHAARQHIDDKLREPLAVEELAAIAGLSQFHFIRAFKDEYGCSPLQYQITQRMALACNLLMSGFGVQETAHRVGYTNLFYFSRLFKAKCGIAPSRYTDHHYEQQRVNGTVDKVIQSQLAQEKSGAWK